MNQNPVVIDIHNIQKELTEGREIKQTYLFNLIVYSPHKKRTHELKLLLNNVIEKFPCRIIQIEKSADPSANEIKAVLTKEKLGKPGSQVICDLIQINVSESQLERVPFLVLPNVVADLPVYLIWGEDPTVATKTLEALQSFSTRLIFNAAWMGNLQSFATRMLSLLKTLKIETMDISWGLLSGWKDLFAQVFDNEEKIKNLQNCKKLKISYSHENNGDAIGAIYFQGFIASQMGWELTAQEIQHDHQKALCYRYKNKDINVILNPDQNHGKAPSSITEVEVTAQDGTDYMINMLKNPLKVALHVSSNEACEMPSTFAIPDINRGFNFLREIFYQPSGEQYTQTLELISKVDWER